MDENTSQTLQEAILSEGFGDNMTAEETMALARKYVESLED
jgi:hypothetical protein